MDAIRLWKVVYYAERLGAGSYWELARHMPSDETRATMVEFGDDERMHARWFAEALADRGRAEPARGDLVERFGTWFAKGLVTVMGRRAALRALHAGERRALADLYRLIDRARDEALRASLERIRPYEEKHTYWWPKEGRHLVRY